MLKLLIRAKERGHEIILFLLRVLALERFFELDLGGVDVRVVSEVET
jgi:hypothetical protein